jgi:hypothetical protein
MDGNHYNMCVKQSVNPFQPGVGTCLWVKRGHLLTSMVF